MNAPRITHLERLKFEGNDAIVLIRCVHSSGADAWLYLRMDRVGYETLLTAHENGREVRFSDHGTVLMFGRGEPDEAVLEMMEHA